MPLQVSVVVELQSKEEMWTVQRHNLAAQLALALGVEVQHHQLLAQPPSPQHNPEQLHQELDPNRRKLQEILLEILPVVQSSQTL